MHKKLYDHLVGKNYIVLILYIFLSYIAYWKLFFLPGDQRLYITSDFVQYWTLLVHVVDEPFADMLWDPNSYLGTHLISRVDLGIFYPPLFLLVVISKVANLDSFSFYVALEAFVVLSVGLGGFFTYLFARRVLDNKVSAFSAGLVFAFSGAMFTFANAFPVINAAIWLPLFCLSILNYLETNRMIYVVLAGLVLSFTYLAGTPQITLYTSLYGVLFFAWHLSFRNMATNQKLRIFATCSIATIFVFVLVIVIPFTLHFYEAIESNRGHMNYINTAVQGNIQILNLIDMVLPHFWEASLIGRNSLYAQNYVGVFPLIALISFPFFIENHKNYYYFLASALFLILGMGGETLLHDVSYLIVPGVSFFRNIAKYHFLFSFSAALVLGLVLDKLITSRGQHSSYFWFFRIIIIILSVVGLSLIDATSTLSQIFSSASPNVGYLNSIKSQMSIVIFQSLLLLSAVFIVYRLRNSNTKVYILWLSVGILFIDLARYNNAVLQNNYTVPPEKPYGANAYTDYVRSDPSAFRVTYLMGTYPANYAPAVVGIENTDGYSSVVPLAAAKIINLRNKYSAKEAYAKISGIMNQKYVVADERFDWPGYKAVFEHRVKAAEKGIYYCPGTSVGWVTCPPGKIFRVYQNTHYIERVHVLENPTVIEIAGRDEQLVAIENGLDTNSLDFSKTVFIDQTTVNPEIGLRYKGVFEPLHESIVRVKNGDVVFISYPYDKSLVVTVNDRIVTTNRTNYAFRSFRISNNDYSGGSLSVKIYPSLSMTGNH